MSAQNPSLPDVAHQNPGIAAMSDVIGLPESTLSVTLLGAQPAIERAQLYEMKDVGLLWFAQPDHPEPQKSSVIHRSDFLIYKVPNKNLDYKSEVHVGIDTIWARSEEELQTKLAQRREYEVAKEAFVAEHPLGQGGLVLANQFGGIDVENPADSAKHLVVRATIARRAQLKEHFQSSGHGATSEYVAAGLLHPLLGRVIDQDFLNLMDNIGSILDAVDLLPDAAKEAAAPALLHGAIEQAKAFVEGHRATIALSAHIMQNPESAESIAKAARKINSSSAQNRTWQSKLGSLAIIED